MKFMTTSKDKGNKGLTKENTLKLNYKFQKAEHITFISQGAKTSIKMFHEFDSSPFTLLVDCKRKILGIHVFQKEKKNASKESCWGTLLQSNRRLLEMEELDKRREVFGLRRCS